MGPVGELTIRPEDHNLTYPVLSLYFSKNGEEIVPKLQQRSAGDKIAPPAEKSLK